VKRVAAWETKGKDDKMAELMDEDHSHDWGARASEALARARKFPLGLKRSEAMRKAAQLRIAADMKEFLITKRPAR